MRILSNILCFLCILRLNQQSKSIRENLRKSAAKKRRIQSSLAGAFQFSRRFTRIKRRFFIISCLIIALVQRLSIGVNQCYRWFKKSVSSAIHYSLLTLHSSPFTLHPSLFTLHPSFLTLHYSFQQSKSIRANPRKSAAKKNTYSKPIYPLLLVALLLFQTACNQQPTESIIAEVGPHTISFQDFETAAERYRHPPADALLEKLIDEKALYHQALKQNLDQDPELQRAWQQLLIAKLREQELEPQLVKAQSTNEAIEAHYQANQQTYTEPAQCHIALIYFDCPPNLRTEKEQQLHERAKAVHQQALVQPSNNSSDFGPLAAEHSHHRPSRYKGGDIGWLQANNTRWEPQVIEAAFTLETIGQVSELIETEQGLYLIKLLETKDASVKPLTEVRPMIQHKLLVEKQKALETQFIQQARDSVQIKIYKKVLDTYEPSK